MFHWRAKVLGLGLLLGLIAGCKQPMFIAERDLQRVGDMLPPTLETDPMAAIAPTVDRVLTPPSVSDPDRKPRYISLEEMIAIGLENGTSNSVRAGDGVIDDRLASFPKGQFNGESETVRVLALQPAFAYTAIENQLARYDGQWITALTSSATDTLQQGLQSFQNGQSANFATGFFKALPSGGIANISFQTDYRLLSAPPTGSFGVLNPSYTTKLVLGIEQPLWRDYGVDINELLTRHPQSVLLNNPGIQQFSAHQANITPFNQQSEGILIARIRYTMQKAEFERQIQALVLNIEVAYWNMYRSYGKLHSATEVFRIAHRVWMAAKARFDAGNMPPSEYYRVLELVHETRAQRQTALADVLEKERNLRRLAGMPIEDGTRLVLISAPNKAQYQPNFEAAVKDAMVFRPELALARENLRISHWQFLREKNSVKPDMRVFGQYVPTGYGTRLDGNGSFVDGIGVDRPANAFRSLASDHFNDWTVGVVLNVPLGYRAELANIRAARLQLAQNYYLVKDQEERAKSYLTQQWQAVTAGYSLIEMRAAQRDASQKGAVALIRAVEIGKEKYDINLLDVIRRLGTSMDAEYDAIFEYNDALARFYWSTGTTLHHNNIYLSEGQLPECAQVRAVEHERERSKACVLRDRPRPLEHPAWFEHLCGERTAGEIVVDDPAAANQPHRLELMPSPTGPATLPTKLPPVPGRVTTPQTSATETLTMPQLPSEIRRVPVSATSSETAQPAASVPVIVTSPTSTPNVTSPPSTLKQATSAASELIFRPAAAVQTTEFRRESKSDGGTPVIVPATTPAPQTVMPAAVNTGGGSSSPQIVSPSVPNLPPLPSEPLQVESQPAR